MTVDELVKIEKDVLLYDNSGGGVTFRGRATASASILKEGIKECQRRIFTLY